MNANYDHKMIDLKDGLGYFISVLTVRGKLDYSNYAELIERTRALYKNGERRLIIDLREVPSIGIAGLFALLSTAVTFNGRTPADAVGGLRALHQMTDAVLADASPNFKLLSTKPEMADALRRAGLVVYEDLDAAIESFYAPGRRPDLERDYALAGA